MDGFSGYNQILMVEEDREKTTFITFWGTFYYKVMPFGLKNARATYQRAMVTLFHDMMHKEIEVYVDDMITKSTSPEQHLKDLRKLFARLHKYRLRLNSTKCTFGVKNGKLLGFVVNERGIEIDLDKVKAIREMLEPKTESEKTEWDSECQKVFEKIKQNLKNPPILVFAVQGRPLILYLIVLDESMGSMLGQQDEVGKEQVIYYLSKKFTDCEKRYPALERTCCTLVWVAKRLKQYMLSHTTLLVAKTDPIKYILEKPALTR
ncbi:Retrovirus-related Pol polyprotein, partial [Mucuna pruriens]